MSVSSWWLALLPPALRAGSRLSSGGVSGRHPVGAIEVGCGRGGAAKRGGRCGRPAGTGARARPARGRLPGTGEAGIRPVKQPVGVVDVFVLIGGKVLGGASVVGESAAGSRTCDDG